MSGGTQEITREDSKEWQDVLDWNDGRWFMDTFKEYEVVAVGADAEMYPSSCCMGLLSV